MLPFADMSEPANIFKFAEMSPFALVKPVTVIVFTVASEATYNLEAMDTSPATNKREPAETSVAKL